MKTKWIFRDDGDLSKDYSDFKTMEVMLNDIYNVIASSLINPHHQCDSENDV
tara:strand:- start:670 stop:825 length:156 start_codon:yes stop_codon:yes gene_type:complete